MNRLTRLTAKDWANFMEQIGQFGPGEKHDGEKVRMDLVPAEAIWQVAEVMTHGCRKYGQNNWQRVDNGKQRYLGAALRHINQWQRGEVRDPESGLNHIAHAACSLFFILWLEENHDTQTGT